MAKTSIRSVDDYLAAQPPASRRILTRVRATLRKALPGAEEVVSYGIPTFKLHGRAVIYFAGWKQHFSLYPSSAHTVSTFKDDLAPYETDKGTIRFPLVEPVPATLITGIARLRAQEVVERASRKSAAAARGKATTAPAAAVKKR